MAEAFDSGTQVKVYKVSGVPGSAVPTTTTIIPIRAGVPPPLAPQLGSGVLLDPSDGRIESAVWQNGSLWGTAPESCKPTGDADARSCLRIVEIRTDTMTARQDLT